MYKGTQENFEGYGYAFLLITMMVLRDTFEL